MKAVTISKYLSQQFIASLAKAKATFDETQRRNEIFLYKKRESNCQYEKANQVSDILKITSKFVNNLAQSFIGYIVKSILLHTIVIKV